MKKRTAYTILVVIFSLPSAITSYAAEAEEGPQHAVRHAFLCSDIGAKCVFRISATGEIEWEYPADQCTDAWMLDNGNILMSFTGEKRGAREVSPDKRVVWEYNTQSEVWGCQRLPNGNTLVAECTAKRLVEVDAKGEIVKSVPVESGGKTHMGMRHARQLANGNYLASLLDDKVVREYDASGQLIRAIEVPDMAFSAIRMENGNTVIGYRGGVIEVDSKDKVVWHLTQEDLPEVKLYWICCVQRLPNGNTVVGNWFIHQRRTDSPPFFEVTPEKKVVWRAAMHERMFDPAAIQILDVEDTSLR
jgi:hypothetical protein